MKIKHRKSGYFILSILIAASAVVPVSAKQKDFTIGFTGDVIMHENIKKFAAVKSTGESNNFGYDYFFYKIAPYLAFPDIMSINMEFPVCPPFQSDGFIFNSPPMITDAFIKAGIDIVNIANNHFTDQKTEGVIFTTELLNSKKIAYIGCAQNESDSRKGIVREINGIRAGLISYTGLLNYPDRRLSDKYYINWIYDREKVSADIADLKMRSDFVIVQIHDGIEYTMVPADWKVKLYREIAELGADLIIGHHPHTIQSSEIYRTADKRDVAIFYSLGNFLADQIRSLPIENSSDRISIKSSFIVYLRLYKKWFKIKHRIEVMPVFTENNIEIINGIKYRNIQIIPIPDEINSLQHLMSDNSENASKYSAKIEYLKSQINSIKRVVFPSGIPDYIKFIE